MKSITLKEVILIHDGIIEKIGGRLGLREPGLLKSIVEKPNTSFAGQDLYETIFDKTASILEALCNYRVFVDGNKRTSIVVAEYFLFINGYTLVASQKEKEIFVLDIANKNLDILQVSEWIKTHSQKTKSK